MSNESNTPTKVDPGWLGNGQTESPATEVDPGWLGNGQTESPATEVDPGWLGGGQNESPATEVDPGWLGGGQATDTKGGSFDGVIRTPEDVMSAATANYYGNIDAFKTDAVKLVELTCPLTWKSYTVNGTISVDGGEAVILKCNDADGKDYAAKVYYKPVNVDGAYSPILEFMKTKLGQKYTLAVIDIGVADVGEGKYYFEIIPFCPEGNLWSKKPISFEYAVELTRQLNEILNCIHKAGIYHRDIKPDNIYILDGQVKLGDFGIAKFDDTGGIKVTKFILGTEGYAAPETRRYVFSNKSDYYSLGVTIASLFEGKFVFENMKYEATAVAQEIERLPIRRLDPNRDKLENLLNGLCRVDSRRRFGYDEVCEWLKNHDYVGVNEFEEGWSRPLTMMVNSVKESYPDEATAFAGLTKDETHWEAGKKMLYGGTAISQFFGTFDTALSEHARDISENYRDKDKSDLGYAMFLKALYPEGPIVWRGRTFRSLGEIANEILTSNERHLFIEMLNKGCISFWLKNTVGITVNEETINLVLDIEELSHKKPALACYWFAYCFAETKKLSICNRSVSTVAELISAMFVSPATFYNTDGYGKLSNQADGAALYGFLFSFGFKALIDKSWEALKDCDTFNKTVVLFSMMDSIAGVSKVDPTAVREFFVNYGPVGIAAYTKKLVSGGADKYYKALDSDGRSILARIRDFKVPSTNTVEALYNAYTPLIDSVSALQRVLIDNPYCIITGDYDKKGVICTNLAGCFAYKIFDRPAPLGFNTVIETNNGGNAK